MSIENLTQSIPKESEPPSPPVISIAMRRRQVKKRKLEDEEPDDLLLKSIDRKPRITKTDLGEIEIPISEKRSKHYNLRAKSKLRSNNPVSYTHLDVYKRQ